MLGKVVWNIKKKLKNIRPFLPQVVPVVMLNPLWLVEICVYWPMFFLASTSVAFFLISIALLCSLYSYWCAEDGFNDGRVKLYQLLLWQVELPQLAKEEQPLLGLFHNELNGIVPLQVLRNCVAQESEWLHCSHNAVHDGDWGECRVLLKSTIISTVLSVLSSRLLRLHQTASSLTSCL